MAKYLKIHPSDSVVVALHDLEPGERVQGVVVKEKIQIAHKMAMQDIAIGEKVIKYGYAIGRATKPISQGEWVHTHNVSTHLAEDVSYQYQPQGKEIEKQSGVNVRVFSRGHGKYGIRNHLFIVPLVGCVNGQAERIKQTLEQQDLSFMDGVIVLKHPFGCSQMGGDKAFTTMILQKICQHPNAGGILVLGLGCEENRIEPFQETLQNVDPLRIRFLKAQDVEDEVASGVKLCQELLQVMKSDARIEQPIACINVGLKCGGSDGFSGITANPLVGLFSDYIVASGGSSVLSEVPEMFGAEQVLMERAKDATVFASIVRLIENFKKYYEEHHQVCYENPSPGNKAGGITTLEDKSLGCVQKAGHGIVQDVLFDNDMLRTKGLSLLNGPGNDMIACTNLAAAGCQLILFTTGRGTPFGTFVPTVKIATNTALSTKKKDWIDFNAGQLVDGISMETMFQQFVDYLVSVINGDIKTNNETNGFQEISIFKDGVTL